MGRRIGYRRHDLVDGFADAAGRADLANRFGKTFPALGSWWRASMVAWIGYGSLIGAPALVLVNILCFFQCAYILLVELHGERASIAERS